MSWPIPEGRKSANWMKPTGRPPASARPMLEPMMVLSASASYIVVPAVLRYAIPEANPSLYFGLALGITFPLNILLGIPLYTYFATTVLG